MFMETCPGHSTNGGPSHRHVPTFVRVLRPPESVGKTGIVSRRKGKLSQSRGHSRSWQHQRIGEPGINDSDPILVDMHRTTVLGKMTLYIFFRLNRHILILQG